MNRERIIRLLEEQLGFAREENRELTRLVTSQSEQITRMSSQIDSLTQTIRSLEEALTSKDVSLEKAENTKKALGKLLVHKSEKITPPPEELPEKTPVSLKERGNNNARRKEHFNLEVEEHDIYPDRPDFDAAKSKLLKTVDSIRYEYIPPRFIKHIHHLHYYLDKGEIVCGKLPSTPLLNSDYDASFLAGILQLRYIYSMPVERIIKFFEENGFELNKSTAHGLVKKAAGMLDFLGQALQAAIQEDDYIHMDESYHTILDAGKEKGSVKGYIWGALAHNLRLVHFFYRDGSRGRHVLTGYLSRDYRGAVQTDGLSCYKILETDEYPHAIRLGCFQHCKRKFLDIEKNKDARRIIDIINKLYRIEHDAPPGMSPPEILRYRKKYATPVMKEFKETLLEIQSKKTTLPKSNLAKAVNYALNEYPALSNYLLDPRYDLDNNAIERVNRYISLSRKNSLFFGSHKGAERAALIYSLACSCRLNGINTFEYFKDILIKLINVHPNTNTEYIRNLLPDKWNK